MLPERGSDAIDNEGDSDFKAEEEKNAHRKRHENTTIDADFFADANLFIGVMTIQLHENFSYPARMFRQGEPMGYYDKKAQHCL